MSIQFKRRAPTTAAKNARPKLMHENQEEDEEDENISIIKQDFSRPSIKGITSSTSSNKNNEESMTATQVYMSNREILPQSYAGDATHTSEIDTAIEKDARTILERNILMNENGILDEEPNIYRGQAGYKNFVKKDISQVGSNKYSGTQGPIRAPAFVRSTARFDYQPDICKDYKETGFCGYGDQCKFLHDRGDYKSGWQMEKEWDAEQAKKKKKLEMTLASFELGEGGGADDEEEDFTVPMDDGLPFACFLCREDFKKPVVTLCSHYFCEACALLHLRKDTRCPVCQKQTSGVLNQAHKLIKQLAIKTGLTESSSSSVSSSRRGQWETVE